MRRKNTTVRTQPDTTVPSPCTGVCRLNSNGLCEGCLRSGDEIRDWIIMDNAAKTTLLKQLEQRRQQQTI